MLTHYSLDCLKKHVINLNSSHVELFKKGIVALVKFDLCEGKD